MPDCINESELNDLMRNIIINFSGITRCNERWMSAHKYTRSHAIIIFTLWDKTDGCTQNEICKISGVSKQQVSAVLKEFEDKKFITRVKDADDERRNKILLTDLGREMTIKVNDEFFRFFKYLMHEFSDKEKKEILNYLIKLDDAYNKALEERGY